jgi:hypothetical protein
MNNKPHSSYKIIQDGVEQVVFNGNVYMARDKRYFSMYIGTGLTAHEALEDMRKTIKTYKWKMKEKDCF